MFNDCFNLKIGWMVSMYIAVVPLGFDMQYLFGDQAQAIESVALIPLGHHCKHGLLAIGSQEASRFHPGMGTLFLTHLGELMDLLLGEHVETPATAG